MSSSSGSVVSDVTDVPDTMDLKEKERLTAVAKAMTEDLLMATDLLGGIPWSLVHEKHGISLFRADVANDVPCNVHAVYKFNSDIEDVAKSMITNTTDSYKSMMRMLSSDFLDGAVVQTIVEPTEQNPYRYVALKWAAFKSSSRFGKDRDFIILEYVDMIEDDQGQKIAFRIMESVDVPNNSPYADSAKYSRDIVPLMGFMYHTTKKPGELRLTYSCNFDKNGDLPAWAANSAIQQHVEMCVTGIAKYIENFRAQKEEIVLPQQVIPMREKQDCCHMCEKKFCMVRRKYNCLKCGEVICSNCSSVRTTIVPDVGERQLRVCTGCVIAVRRSSKTPVPPEGGLGLGSVASPASRAASTVTVDTDVASIRCGSSNHGNASICRTQSFNSQGKRRSLDDVLDPVRSRLIEYKTFSDSAEAVQIPKASFPTRSFSDGIIKGGTLFHAKRRGSPADLAISIEAFRQHQSRMGNADDASSHDSSESDEETMEQLQYLSTSSTSTGSPSSQNSSVSPPARERFPAAEPFSPLASRDKQRQRVRGRQDRRKTATVDYSSYEQLYAVPGVNDDSRCRFKEAAERAPDLIDQAKSTHHLAQHVRRKVHHRVAALRMEEQDDSGIPDNQDPHHQPQITYTSYSPSSQTEIECNISIIPPARVRRAVCQTKNGTVLYGRKPVAASLEMEVDQQIQLLSRGLAEVHPSNQSVDAHYRRQPQHGSSRYY